MGVPWEPSQPQPLPPVRPTPLVAEKAPEVTPESADVRDLTMAFQLAEYGRKNKSAEALLTARHTTGRGRVVGTVHGPMVLA